MATSYAQNFQVNRGGGFGEDWLNDTGADVSVGNAIKMGSVQGIVVGGNSMDGSTKVLSTVRGVVCFGPPGFEAIGPAFTTDSWATGSLIYMDLTNQRFTSTAVSTTNGGLKVGYAADSKAAGVAFGRVFWNQTLPV